MTTRLLTFALALSLLAVVVGRAVLHTTSSELGEVLLSYGAKLASLLAWGLLLSTSTLIGTRYFRLILLWGVLLLVGGLFKISHYPSADAMLWAGLGGIALTYAVRFVRKIYKNHFDVLKLLLVLVACGSALLQLLHLAPREIQYLPPCLLGLAVLDCLYLEGQKRRVAQAKHP
jgi:hypothetical protein